MKLLLSLLLLLTVSGAAAQSDTTLTRYVGTYKFPQGSDPASVEVSVRDGGLFGTASLGSAFLVESGKDTFTIEGVEGYVYFYRNDKGKVARLRLVLDTLDLEGKKEGE